MNKAIAFRLAAIAGLSLLLTVRIAQVQRTRHEAAAPHGRYTVDQIIARSLPLCGAISRSTDSLRLTACPLCAWALGKAQPMWMVDAVDDHDGFRAHLLWDADTGELISISRPGDWIAPPDNRRTLQRNEVRRLTSSWLTTLGMSEVATGWRPDSLTHSNEDTWRVEWRSRTHCAEVIIDSHTGELIMAQTIKSTRGEAYPHEV